MSDYTSKLTTKQKEFFVESLARDTRLNVATGAVRSGKSVITAVMFFLHVKDAPKENTHAAVGNTKHSVHQNIVSILQDPTIMGSRYAAMVKGSRGADHFTINGRRVNIHGAYNASADSRIKGATYQFMIFDEATTLDRTAFAQALARMSAKGAKCWVTTNPDHAKHWLKVEYIDNPELKLFHESFGIDDNETLEPDYVEGVKQMFRGNQVFYDRNILGKWVSGQGLVYEHFNEARHVVDVKNLPPIKYVYSLGVDAGFKDATAAVMLGLSAEKVPRLVVLGEYRHDNLPQHAALTAAQIADDLTAWYDRMIEKFERADFVYVDPSASWLLNEMRNRGIRNSDNAVNDVLAGLGSVSSLFSMDRLVISSDCVGILDEINAYSWDDKSDGAKPKDGNDHSMDALRYAVHSVRHKWELDLGVRQTDWIY